MGVFDILSKDVLDSHNPQDEDSVLSRDVLIEGDSGGGGGGGSSTDNNAFYTKKGVFLGYESRGSNSVYISTKENYEYSLGIADKSGKINYESLRKNSTQLSILHTQLISLASIVYGESSFFMNVSKNILLNEMKSLAYVHKNYPLEAAYGINSTAAKYFRIQKIKNRNNTTMMLALEAQIFIELGGEDLSSGARFWDGSDQVGFDFSNDKRSDVYKIVKNQKFTCELHMNTRGWTISDEHYFAWKSFYGSRFKAPQKKFAITGRNTDNITLKSTAVWGGTIFWEEVNITKT